MSSFPFFQSLFSLNGYRFVYLNRVSTSEPLLLSPESKENIGIFLSSIFEEEIEKIQQGKENNLFDLDEDNAPFLDDEGFPTKGLYELLQYVSDDINTYLQNNFTTNEDLLEQLNNDHYLNLLRDHVFAVFETFIYRGRLDHVLSDNGMDALMNGFINCNNNKAGSKLYKKKTDVLLDKMRNEDLKVTMLFTDLDNFKLVNDTYGHDVGDLALKHTSGVISSSLRNTSKHIRVRMGGEEIAVVMVGATEPEGVIAAERIRTNLEKSPLCLIKDDDSGLLEPIPFSDFQALFDHNNIIKKIPGERGIEYVCEDLRGLGKTFILHKIPLTLSMGVAECPDRESNVFERAKKLADDGAYLAKKSGRNCTAVQGKIVDEKYLEECRQACQSKTK